MLERRRASVLRHVIVAYASMNPASDPSSRKVARLTIAQSKGVLRGGLPVSGSLSYLGRMLPRPRNLPTGFPALPPNESAEAALRQRPLPDWPKLKNPEARRRQARRRKRIGRSNH